MFVLLWYAIVWYDKKESMRLYAIVWNSNALVWDSNAMLWDSNVIIWDLNAMLCCGVCCKTYAWTDCMKMLNAYKM